MAVRDLTVRERILLHLFDYNRYADAYEAPLEVTQEGIARAVGIRVHHVSQYVKPLISEELVQEKTSHIRRKARSRKVYFLATKGRFQVASQRNSLLKEQIPFRTRSGDLQEVPLSQAYQELRRGSSLLELLGELGSLGYVSDVTEAVGEELVDLTQEAPKVDTFYGREEELERALQAFDQAPFVVVTGMAGVGKTTLGSKICDILRGQRSLFWRQVRSWDTAMDLALRLAAFLKSLGRTGLHSSLTGPGPKELSRIEEVLAADLAGIDSLLILDDVHSASEDAQAFLSILLRVLKIQKGTSALLLSRRVPEFYSRREVVVEDSVVEIPLKGLDLESSQSLLAEAGIAETLLGAVLKAAGGNPLFLKLLASTGPEGAPEESLRTLETYISEEIEPSLEQGERRCLEAASFYQLPVPSEGLLLERGVRRRTLVGLQRKGLLDRVDPDRFILHSSLQTYFQEGLSLERREALVPKVVSWLRKEARALADGGNPHEAIMHLGNAVTVEVDPVRETSSLERLAELRCYVGDYPGAIEAYRSALMKTTDVVVRARLSREIGRCFISQGDLEQAEREIQAGLESLPAEPSLEAGWLLHWRATAAYERQDYGKALEDIERVRSWMARLPPDPNLSGWLANLWGLIYLEDPNRMDAALAHRAFQEAIEVWKASGEKANLCLAYNNLGLAAVEMGRFEQALSHLDESAAIAEELGNLPVRAAAHFSKARVLSMCLGDHDAAEALYHETYRLSKETNRRSMMIWHFWHFADLYRHQGRIEEARESLDYFLEASGDMLNAESRIAYLSLMVRLCILSDDPDSAKAYLDEAEILSRQASSDYASHSIEWAKGSLCSYQGNLGEAEASFLRALNISVSVDRGEFLLDYGRFLASSGDRPRAKDILTQACKELSKISRPLERAARDALGSLESASDP
ncbi:MAG: tetratricopeptide repeat protein [Thermoplasmata archaeon]